MAMPRISEVFVHMPNYKSKFLPDTGAKLKNPIPINVSTKCNST